MTQVLKFAGFVRVATGSILVYAYILMYYTKNRGFENQWFLKGGLFWDKRNGQKINQMRRGVKMGIRKRSKIFKNV